MAHPLKHAESSARRFGGKAEDYLAIHNWFDESKSFFTDFRHRAHRHHAEGILLCERIFGVAITNSQGKQVPVRYIGEQHVREDLGRIPTAQDWLSQIKPVRWMYGQRFTDSSGGTCPYISAATTEAKRPQLDTPGTMALEVVLARYFQMAALGADKRPIRERNHRHELVAYDTIRAPKYSLRHRCNSAGNRG